MATRPENKQFFSFPPDYELLTQQAETVFSLCIPDAYHTAWNWTELIIVE